MTAQLIRLDRTTDGIAIITLARAGSRNALTLDMVHDLRAALSEAEADPDCRVVILVGEGKAFCAGLDLKQVILGDSLKYNVFPNVIFYPAPGLALIQLFRPDGHDQDHAIFDMITLRPKPTDGSDFEVAQPVDIVEGEGFASKGGMDPFLGSVLDQDTEIMRWQREGMYASGKGAATLSAYQESRIRHVHDTLDKYLDGRK